jgi:antibiotic biosynthesis monooxygenase (ABM) superfamily enzyme
MTSSPSQTPGSQIQLRGPQSSSVIVQRVAPGNREVFLEWQRGVTAAAAAFPGYQATEIYPPAPERPLEWVIVIHFDSEASLRGWLDSPQRAEWTAKLPREIREFRLKTLPSGFAAWFAGPGDEPLPHWKVFLMVLFGLYPTVVVLAMFLSPFTNRLGLAVALLIGNVASCAFLEWLGSPVIRLLLGPWLRARGKEGRRRNLVGTALIVASLAAMAVLFHFVAG